MITIALILLCVDRNKDVVTRLSRNYLKLVDCIIPLFIDRKVLILYSINFDIIRFITLSVDRQA